MTGSGMSVLTNCSVIDVVAETATAGQGVWIAGGRLREIGPADEVLADALAAGPGVDVTDLDGAFLLPGLMNMHTHLGLTYTGREPDRSPAARALRMAANAQDSLRAGVTTIRLLGEHDGTDFDLRDAIRGGRHRGPTIITAGRPLCCTGGHGSGYGPSLELDGPAEFARGARTQIALGADLIKICISGGIGGMHERVSHSQLLPEEVTAVTTVAHGWNRLVTAHAGPANAIDEALDCGLDGVEHGYAMDDAVIAKMVALGTWLVPTLAVTRGEEFYKRHGAPSWILDKVCETAEAHAAGIRAAIRAGARIALGTDMLPSEELDGTTATVRELELLVEAGLTPGAALRSATCTAAEYAGLTHDAGTIEVGKRADLIAVALNPLLNISHMRELTFVMKDGEPITPAPEGTRS
jgi:imidazolonepropionase-like amidohydrolase